MLPYLRFSNRIFVASLVLVLSLINSASPLQSQQEVELKFDDGTFEQFVGFNTGQGVLDVALHAVFGNALVMLAHVEVYH